MKLTIELPDGKALEFTHSNFAAMPASMQIDDASSIDDRRNGKAIRFAEFLQAINCPDDANACVLHASADDYSNRVPMDAVKDGYLIYERDGQPLLEEHGGPFRFFIPNTAQCGTAPIDNCANVKFVDRIEVVY